MAKRKEVSSIKKILIINYEYPPLGGGGGVATQDLAQEWVKNAQVDVLTSSFKGLPSYELVNGVNVYRAKIFFRTSRDVATFFSMLSYVITGFFLGVSLIKKNHYDIINTQFAVPSGPLGLVLSKIFKIKNVLSLHGGDIYDPSKKMSPHRSIFFRAVVNLVLQKADAIFSQSTNTRDNALKYYSPKQTIGVIPLPFCPPKQPKITRKALGIDQDKFVLVFIGRLIKRKDIGTALRALSLVKSQNWHYCIIGDGPERTMLESLAKELAIQDHIQFLGFVDEETKYRYLSVSDCMLVTSLHEGFGIIFMEAMYFGLPIICTNNGGQVDFLKHKKNALLCDVGDNAACAKHIEEMMKNSKLQKSLSQRNAAEISRFYAPAVAAEYMSFFELLRRKVGTIAILTEDNELFESSVAEITHPCVRYRSINALRNEDHSLLVIDADIFMDDVSFQFDLSRIRKKTLTLPVILVVKSAHKEKLNFDWFFDDFILFPYRKNELTLRLMKNLRTGGVDEPGNSIKLGHIEINLDEYIVSYNGEKIDFTYKEFELLKFLLQNRGKVFTRKELLSRIWGVEYIGGTRTVDVHIRRLRGKLGSDFNSLIETVRNVGYRCIEFERNE